MPDKQRTRAYHGRSAGAVNVSEAEIVIGDAAKRVLIDTLPAGAVITNSWVEVLQAFNAGTSNLLTLGYGAIAAGTADDYVDTVTENTPGVYAQGTPGKPFPALAAAQDVYVYYTPGASGGTTGRARAFVEWVRTADNG